MEKAEKHMILLGQVIPKLINNQRLLVVDENGQELYRGFVANFEHDAVDTLKPVKEIRLATETFRRGNFRDRIPQKEKEAVITDDFTAFQFSDLEFAVYIKITLEQ